MVICNYYWNTTTWRNEYFPTRTDKAHSPSSLHKCMEGSGSAAPCDLILGCTWRWLVSFTPRLPYLQEKKISFTESGAHPMSSSIQQARWVPEPVTTLWSRENVSWWESNDDSSVVQSVVTTSTELSTLDKWGVRKWAWFSRLTTRINGGTL